jgi:predicted transcriptional regulator
LTCDLDENTGAASVTEENRKLVEEAHKNLEQLRSFAFAFAYA